MLQTHIAFCIDESGSVITDGSEVLYWPKVGTQKK